MLLLRYSDLMLPAFMERLNALMAEAKRVATIKASSRATHTASISTEEHTLPVQLGLNRLGSVTAFDQSPAGSSPLCFLTFLWQFS
jgi:hypothetical protein